MRETSQPDERDQLSETVLLQRLRELRQRIPDDPWVNPIASVAFELSRRFEAGEISFSQLKALSRRLMDRACKRRALRIRDRVSFESHEATIKDFQDYVRSTIDRSIEDKQERFTAFVQRWSRARTGIVLTAHPTFALSDALSRQMIEIAFSDKPVQQTLNGFKHRPDEGIDLSYEHERAQSCIDEIRSASYELFRSFFFVAVEEFGERAYELRPNLATFASWVGYDLDGRTDITWLTSFVLRLKEKRSALEGIRTRFITLREDLGRERDVERLSRQVIGKLDLAIAAVDEQIVSLENIGSDHGGLDRAANTITRQDSYNLTSIEQLVDPLTRLVQHAEKSETKQSIAALVSLINATKLGTAHIHVRINATQLNNAFRAFVHEPWTKDLSESQAQIRISEMIANVEPETVNFGTLELETATAIRQFALIAQIQKFVDAQTPIRFLVAECETPSTILIAVFFARLFGISKIVDISPLFETPEGLENGGRLLERLLQEEGYRAYVQERGRLAIQTGFSDAGRFVGQIAATLAIERLHQTLASLMSSADLGDVEALIFSTHGESMGRGAHPGPLPDRLRYVFSDESRKRFVQSGLNVKHETSFQGGDGFTFFANRELATRTLALIVQDGEVSKPIDDPFYQDQGLNLDFYLRLKSYQQNLFGHVGYRALLGAFGPNLLFKTGSRPIKRQSDHATPQDRGDPARMRAIPNNAILQQFGYIANIVAGLGAAVGSQRDRVIELAQRSRRLKTCFEMVARGKQLSSLNAMGANAAVFDAGFWASRASWGREPSLEPAFRALSRFLLNDQRDEHIKNLTHHLRLDAIQLHQILEEIGLEGGKTPDDARLELDLLQAVRLALIMRIFILSAQLPRFAPRNDLSYEQMLEWALGMDIPEVLSFMRQTFPHAQVANFNDQFDERASYRPKGIDDYARLETEILEPMEDAFDFVRELGTGISHHFGAFG